VDDIAVLMAVGVRSVPPAARRLVTLEGPDYADYFVAATSGAGERTAEQWARTILEGTHAGRSAPALWRLLGLRLGPRPSPDHVQGWHIAGRGDDWLRAETSSWYMTAQAIVGVDGDEVSLALFLRFDRRIARLVWTPVGVMHRRGVPAMLRQAVMAQGPVARRPGEPERVHVR
jgi:hypothetical protein